jgi:hypothetical protein
VDGAAESPDRGGVAGELHTVRQQHQPRAGRGVQGDAGAGETGVRHRRRRPRPGQDVEAVPWLDPAQAAAAAGSKHARRLARFRFPAQGGGHGAPIRTGTGAHPPGREPRQVRHGGEQPGVPGDAAHHPRVLVVHSPVPWRPVVTELGRREPRRRAGRAEARLRHAERPAHHLLEHGVKGRARHGRDHLAQRHEPQVGVLDPGPWRRFQLSPVQRVEQFASGGAPLVELHGAGQPRRVREQLPDGHLPRCRRQVASHQVVKPKLAGGGQGQHQRGCRHRFRQRREVEHGPRGHRAFRARRRIRETRRPRAQRRLAAPGRRHRTRNPAGRDRGGDDLADPVQLQR